jgi:hypothetical protein
MIVASSLEKGLIRLEIDAVMHLVSPGNFLLSMHFREKNLLTAYYPDQVSSFALLNGKRRMQRFGWKLMDQKHGR